MLRFSRYAESKFDILNSLGCFIIREQVEEAFNNPDTYKKQGRYFRYQKDKLAVLIKKRGDIHTIITFFPTN
jgi:hypothetical protein